MNNRAKRAYDKAMNYYEKGKINTALELCDEILSEGLDNPIVLNLKGLLLYQKGNLDEAVAVWKINIDLNDDNIAKNYIKDSVADEKRLELYKQAEQAIKQFEIDKALKLFNICAESDFNLIKVNTGIAMCYQKKGEFYKAKEYVNKVLSIDKDAITAKIIQKDLKETGIYVESKKTSTKFIIGLTVLLLILVIGVGGYLVTTKLKNEKSLSSTQEEKNSVALEKQNDKNQDGETEIKQNSNSGEVATAESAASNFDKEKLKTLITNNDLDGIYDQLKNVKKESISNEDVEIYNKAINIMKNEGVSKFYESGLKYFNQGEYSAAKASLDKAYTYSEGSSIKEHILFYRASNSANKSDNQNALEQFEDYYRQYPNGVYTQEALYELALINSSVDKEKSKIYANELIKKFPNSIYANDNIKNILKS